MTAQPRASARRIETLQLAKVSPETVDFLWRRRIPRGKTTLLVGDPGVGKSYACLAVAAGVTAGTPLPDGEYPDGPRSVLLWSGEDGLADTTRVRAETLGAALDRLHVIEGEVGKDGGHLPFTLASVGLLAETIRSIGDVSLVIVDPLAALLGRVDAHRDSDVRAALQPLVDLARETGVAVLAVMHLRKSEAQRALYRVGGSIGFVALARSVLLAAQDADTGRRAIAPLKANLASFAHAVEYRIDDEGCWLWGSVAPDLDAERLLRSTNRDLDTVVGQAEAFLLRTLGKEPRPSRDVESEARSLSISTRTLARARLSLGVIAERAGGLADRGNWVLRLPNSATAGVASLGVLDSSLSKDEIAADGAEVIEL